MRYTTHLSEWSYDANGSPCPDDPRGLRRAGALLPHGDLDWIADADEHVMLYRWADDIWYPIVDLS